MNGILDRVARHSAATRYTEFYPATPLEFFALRLAAKLRDVQATRHYVELAERYSEAHLLVAYRRAKTKGSASEPARSFHVELDRIADRSPNGATGRCLAAIRIEKRAAAIAIFKEDRVAYPPVVRQIPVDTQKAVASVVTFLRWMIEKCPFQSAALELVAHSNDAKRFVLTEAVREALSEQAVSIWAVSKSEVLGAYGYPPPRFRKQIRQIAISIWPGVNGSFGAPLLHDALALGLYCQTEYLFNL